MNTWLCCRAHNTLFIAELASQQYRLPPHLQAKSSSSSSKKGSKSVGNRNDDVATDQGMEEEAPMKEAAGFDSFVDKLESSGPLGDSREHAGLEAQNGTGGRVANGVLANTGKQGRSNGSSKGQRAKRAKV